jgi:hypothetical protein
MAEEQIVQLLKRSQLSITDSRRKILEIFIETGSAMAHHDIEEKTSEKYDRVTVYRTLQTFMEKGIIHTIPTTVIQSNMLYVKMTVQRVIIMIIIFILFVRSVEILPVWMRFMYLQSICQKDTMPTRSIWL